MSSPTVRGIPLPASSVEALTIVPLKKVTPPAPGAVEPIYTELNLPVPFTVKSSLNVIVSAGAAGCKISVWDAEAIPKNRNTPSAIVRIDNGAVFIFLFLLINYYK
jgi:hypothetical protein